MSYFGKLFQRPAGDSHRYREAMSFLNRMSAADRADIGIKPADFPGMARRMAKN
ncbi:hypothetical protein [Mesorhizobium xinjiangense]|uniref:hypothetical protein n=1 Tax=Mesorhizobium xinjiangense TaxID=2678685 RepID=UPI0018DC00A0|nr:hypothetical protein [Mesorhizobium xinjiangense]